MITDKITVYWNNHKLESEGYLSIAGNSQTYQDWQEFIDENDSIMGMEHAVEIKDGIPSIVHLEELERILLNEQEEAQLEREHIKLEKMI